MSKDEAGCGCSFPMLFLLFLVLKLTGVITWSWWFVTMPLWIGLAIIGVIIIMILFAMILVGLFAIFMAVLY